MLSTSPSTLSLTPQPTLPPNPLISLTYIFHSGFVVETDRCLLVFDYWMDPAHVMDRYSHTSKHVYVFASHFHEDHFSRNIFGWRKANAAATYTYILSKDIRRRRRATPDEADAWLVKGDVWEDANIRVIATGSNDSGVSWIVEICQPEVIRLFHAGDLCNWYARFLSEPDVPETIISEEFGEVNPKAEEKKYLGELKDVARLLQQHGTPPIQAADRCTSAVTPGHGSGRRPYFDIVMFPVDGRIGNGYTLGARQFISQFETGLFVPMHFVASGFQSAWRMAPFCEELGLPFWPLHTEGESIHLLPAAPYQSQDEPNLQTPASPHRSPASTHHHSPDVPLHLSPASHQLMIRSSYPEDLPDLQHIFSIARHFMRETGNPHQWAETYPSEEQLLSDIASGDSHVILSHGKVVATFLLRGGNDPTYNVIYQGSWLNDAPYATIHRIASNGEVSGIFHQVMHFALQRYRSIRIDTHRDNRVMQHAILREGFRYCGIIHCWNGDERLAYQYAPQ